MLGTREGAKITSSRRFFLSHIAKTFVGEHFSVSLISRIGNFLASEGYVTIFDLLSNFFCVTVPKNFVGEPLVFY